MNIGVKMWIDFINQALGPRAGILKKILRYKELPTLVLLAVIIGSCNSPTEYREKADAVADDVIKTTQEAALGKTEPFSSERPSDILRRRLMAAQDLPHSSEASLGTDQLEHIDHWPDEDYPPPMKSSKSPMKSSKSSNKISFALK